MTAVVFRSDAAEDLHQIIAWYEEVAPHALSCILADIYRSIDQLLRHPRSGTQVPGRMFRRIVTLRYQFKIAYEVDADRIVILGIFRYQNRES
jgi:plasmid stabilization system protein ParE